MSDGTMSATEETVWKRTANIKEVVGLVLTLALPVGGWMWSTSARQAQTEAEVRQQRKDFEAAKLPEEHDRLLRIEKDTEWTRKAVERIEAGLARPGSR